jgi:flagellar motor switch/type III secretory pathway protein FliN
MNEADPSADVMEGETAASVESISPMVPENDGAVPVSVKDLKINLDFYLDAQKFTVDEISHWMQGSVVPFQKVELRSGLHVEVRNGNQIVARGTLIQLDDAFGLMVEESFIRRASDSSAEN